MEYYAKFLHILVAYQYELNRYISSTIRNLNDESSLSASFLVLGIAFVYGLVHAIGPGHGKALVAFYFTSNKSDYKKAFKMGYMISAIHAISALIFTFGIFLILKTMFRKHFDSLSSLTMQISAGMIMMVGLYLIYEAFKSRYEREKKIKKEAKSEIAVALSAGIVPCPGVMTIVLFCVVLGQYTLGIMAAIAMSIGMGLTISIAGILSIALNKRITNKVEKKTYIFEMLGGFLVFSLGSFLLIGSLH
jgi:ABC-type nickel/cobalt efflux system permease component RcnA